MTRTDKNLDSPGGPPSGCAAAGNRKINRSAMVRTSASGSNRYAPRVSCLRPNPKSRGRMRRLASLGIPILAAVLRAQQADIRIEVGLVTVTCEATDRGGVPAKNLQIEDFELRDNGKLQKIDHVWQEQDLPLTIGLIVDVSGSQSAFIDQHRQTLT